MCTYANYLHIRYIKYSKTNEYEYEYEDVDEYAAMQDQWIRELEDFLFLYDICRTDSFEYLQQVMPYILKIKEDEVPYCAFVLAGI